MKCTFEELLIYYTKCHEETTNCLECPLYPSINGLDFCEALSALGRLYTKVEDE